jgi:hypothetical protein
MPRLVQLVTSKHNYVRKAVVHILSTTHVLYHVESPTPFLEGEVMEEEVSSGEEVRKTKDPMTKERYASILLFLCQIIIFPEYFYFYRIPFNLFFFPETDFQLFSRANQQKRFQKVLQNQKSAKEYRKLRLKLAGKAAVPSDSGAMAPAPVSSGGGLKVGFSPSLLSSLPLLSLLSLLPPLPPLPPVPPVPPCSLSLSPLPPLSLPSLPSLISSSPP